MKMEKIFRKLLKENNKLIFKRVDRKIDDLAVITLKETRRIEMATKSIMNREFKKLDSRIRGINGRLDYFAENYVKKS